MPLAEDTISTNPSFFPKIAEGLEAFRVSALYTTHGAQKVSSPRKPRTASIPVCFRYTLLSLFKNEGFYADVHPCRDGRFTA